MLLCGPEVRRALRRLGQRDPSAFVTLGAAAAMHLGRTPALPLSIATAGAKGRFPDAPWLERVTVPRRATASEEPMSTAEGVRVATLEATIVALCDAEATTPGAIATAAELLRSESALDRRPVDHERLVVLALEVGARRPATARRVGFLLERVGRADIARPLRALPQKPIVPLDAAAKPIGPRWPSWGLVLNACDGLPDLEGTLSEAFALALPAAVGRSLPRLAALFDAGIGLSEARIVSAREPADVRSGLTRCHALGFVVAAPRGLVPRPPFDAVCALLARRLAAKTRTSVLRTMARVLARSREAADLADAALLLEAAGGKDAARALLEEHLDRIVEGAHGTQVEQLLARLPVDRSLDRVRRALLERAGRHDEVARMIDARLRTAKGAERAALLSDASRVSWARGNAEDALARLDEFDALPDRARTRPTRFAATAHRAMILAFRGQRVAARSLLESAMALARDDADRAQAFYRFGLLEAMEGAPVAARAAYTAAVEVLERSGRVDRVLRGKLLNNLAGTSLWLGKFDEASRYARLALEDKLAVGTPSAILTTRMLVALIDRDRGVPVGVEGRMGPLAMEADRLGDARLSAEAWAYFAVEAAFAGDLPSADAALDRARAAGVRAASTEPLLASWVAVASGLVRVRHDDPRLGLEEIESVLPRLTDQFPYQAAIARRAAAFAALRAAESDRALSHLAISFELCRRRGFELGQVAEYVEIYALGALEGDDALRSACGPVLAALGVAEVQRLLVQAKSPLVDRARPQALLPAPPQRRLEETRLRAGVPGAIVIDHAQSNLILPGGLAVPLARRRVLSVLLQTLSNAAGDVCTFDDLARRVWDRRDSSSTRAAIVMSVSRLRSLVGPLGGAIESATRHGESGYRWNPKVPVLAIGEPTKQA